jgi:hypothetical protein
MALDIAADDTGDASPPGARSPSLSRRPGAHCTLEAWLSP